MERGEFSGSGKGGRGVLYGGEKKTRFCHKSQAEGEKTARRANYIRIQTEHKIAAYSSISFLFISEPSSCKRPLTDNTPAAAINIAGTMPSFTALHHDEMISSVT